MAEFIPDIRIDSRRLQTFDKPKQNCRKTKPNVEDIADYGYNYAGAENFLKKRQVEHD